LKPVSRRLAFLGCRKDVLYGIGDDEVLAGLEAVDWPVFGKRHWGFLMSAVIGEVANWIEKYEPGGRVSLPIVPVFFFRKLLGRGFLSPFRCPKVLPSPYSVCACSPCSNSPLRFAAYANFYFTMGFEVV
jgi:hypothetical protein